MVLNLWLPRSLFTQNLVFLQPLHHWCGASAYQQLAGGEFLFTTQDPPDWRQLHPPRSLGAKPEGYQVCCHLCGVFAWRLWVPETWVSWFGEPRPYHTLLLLESEKTLLSQLPLDCSPAMVRLIKTCSAVKNLQQLAQDADLALLQVHNRRPVSNAAAPDLNVWTRKALRVQPSRLFALIWDIIVSRASLAHCHNFIQRQLS